MLETSALCALHPDALATFICERCGSFGCESCRSDTASAFCHACKAPLLKVLRGGLGFVSLIRDSLPYIFSRNLLGLWILVLVWLIADLLLAPLTSALMIALEELDRGIRLLLLGLPSLIVNLFLHASITWWMGEGFLARRKRSLVTAVLAGPASTPRLTSLWILTVAFLFLVFSTRLRPSVVLLIVWPLALPGVVLDGLGAMAALRRTFALTQGYRWSLLALFFCYFVANALLVSAMKFLQVSSGSSFLLVKVSMTLVVAPLRIILSTALTLFYLRRTH